MSIYKTIVVALELTTHLAFGIAAGLTLSGRVDAALMIARARTDMVEEKMR